MYLHFKSILAAHVLLLEIITGMEFKSKCNIGLFLAEGQILVNCKSKKKYLLWTNKSRSRVNCSFFRVPQVINYLQYYVSITLQSVAEYVLSAEFSTTTQQIVEKNFSSFLG